MKAVYIEKFGGPEVQKYGDLPDPVPGPGQVLVDVHAASINAADWKVRKGHYGRGDFPMVLGRDFSGVVGALGEGVTDLRVGDEVFGVLEAGREGAQAEKLVVGASIIARKPKEMSHADAAALALTGLTAWCSLESMNLKPGETILVQGGAGGVASAAVQMAKHMGLRVITTTSTKNIAALRELGADEVIDYTTTDFTTLGRTCDAVLDTVGGDVIPRSFLVLKPGGRAAFVGSGPKPPETDRQDVTSIRPSVPRERRHLERVLDFWAKGALRPLAVTVYPLSEGAEALRVSETRHLRGKLVLKVR